MAAGNHKIDVVADSVNQVTEVDEENNTRVVNIPPPDLVVRDISWSPPDAAIGETVTFTATVLNQGSGQAPESQVSYYIDGEAAGTWSLPEMNPGGTSSPTFAWTAKAGAHVIRIAADAVNRVTESDETNNEKQTNFGTLTADLVIQSVGWYIDDPRIKDMVTFTVTIENQGSTAAGGSKLSYSINDNPGVPEAIKPILPGAALTVKLFANLGAGNHTLTLTADADNAVTEIDETNNGKTLSFSTIAPDLMVKSITWSPEKFAAGENVTITVEVENQGRTRATNSRVELRLGGASLGYAEIEEVVVGTPVKRDFIWTAVPGVHEINGIIDVDGLVLESNEANNTAITTLSLEVPVLSKKPAKISTAGAPDQGFLESSWWLILLAAAVLGGAAFYLALKAVRKS